MRIWDNSAKCKILDYPVKPDNDTIFVMPLQNGIQKKENWIPACAGMTHK